MAPGTIDTTAVLSVTIPLAASIITGGLAMAWRLGGLERAVKDLADNVVDNNGRIDRVEAKISAGVVGGRRASDPKPTQRRR